ncbi:MAG: sigma-54 dependent transcriptional regulator [Verrucomicrobiota bacterium]
MPAGEIPAPGLEPSLETPEAPSPSGKNVIGVIDDERNIQITLQSILARHGYESVPAFTAKQGLAMIRSAAPGAILLDLGLPDAEGLELLRQVRSEHPGLPVIVVTAHDSLNNAIESIKMGAFHFLSKPYVPEELLNLVGRACAQADLREETAQLREETTRLKRRIHKAEQGTAPVFRNQRMVELAELVDQVAPSDANVLLVGESGVGKEVFANLLHEHSQRANGPLIKLNCAAFPQNMIEGELFGYKKGAFTGALQDFPGMLSAAGGGTLFLDEISEMPSELQTRFLRVLQEREYRPLGTTKTEKADFRLIAASNRRPDQAIQEGLLREDLFYRLNTFTFYIPPLRERTDDIPELAEQFLRRFGERLGKKNLRIQPETYELLFRYPWPGNVRELQNAIERAVVLARKGEISPDTLPPEIIDPSRAAGAPPGAPPLPAEPAAGTAVAGAPAAAPEPTGFNLAEREKATLLAALAQCNGNKKKAAELLGIHRPTLYTKLKKFGLKA